MRPIDADSIKIPHFCLATDRIKMMDAIDDAPTIEVPTWIPCSERLPSVFQKAVVCNIHGEMMIGTYTEFGWMFPCYFEKPIAWMPLPKPYKEKHDE